MRKVAIVVERVVICHKRKRRNAASLQVGAGADTRVNGALAVDDDHGDCDTRGRRTDCTAACEQEVAHGIGRADLERIAGMRFAMPGGGRQHEQIMVAEH